MMRGDGADVELPVVEGGRVGAAGEEAVLSAKTTPFITTIDKKNQIALENWVVKLGRIGCLG
jgi:hypothetical protein